MVPRSVARSLQNGALNQIPRGRLFEGPNNASAGLPRGIRSPTQTSAILAIRGDQARRRPGVGSTRPRTAVPPAGGGGCRTRPGRCCKSFSSLRHRPPIASPTPRFRRKLRPLLPNHLLAVETRSFSAKARARSKASDSKPQYPWPLNMGKMDRWTTSSKLTKSSGSTVVVLTLSSRNVLAVMIGEDGL